MEHDKAKERALRHRAKVGRFFKTIGSGIATGAKAVKDKALAPVGTYAKTMVIGERDLEKEQQELIKERLARFHIDPNSILYQRLLKDPPTEEELQRHRELMTAVSQAVPKTE